MRYRTARALLGNPSDDDLKADRLTEEISALVADLLFVLGSKVTSDYLEVLAYQMRHARIEPMPLQKPHLRGLLDPVGLKRPPHRRKGSLSEKTGYGRWEEYSGMRDAGASTMEIARHAQRTSDDYGGERGLATHRMRVVNVLKYGDEQLARRRKREAERWEAFRATLPNLQGLLDLAAAMPPEKKVRR